MFKEFLVVISFVFITKSAPIGTRNCLNKDIQGLKIEDAQFVAPLLVQGEKDKIYFPSKENPVGFANAANLKGQLMDLEHFQKNFKVPDNIGLVYVDGPIPFGLSDN